MEILIGCQLFEQFKITNWNKLILQNLLNGQL